MSLSESLTRLEANRPPGGWRRWLTWLRQWWVSEDQESVHYVGSSEALPPPLTGDEEATLLTHLAQGEHHARGILIERNLRLVVYIARKFENTGVGIEDLVSIGTIGLIKAVNTFNVEKKIKLATYASKCIENEILMYLRRNSRTRSEVSFDEPLNVDWDGNELLLSDVLGTETDIIYKPLEEEVDRTMLRRALNKLTAREKRIMELRFGLKDGLERTQKEVADTLGISQSYISRLEKRILKRLQKEFRRME
ncbi:RNA polymerase sigma-e factor [Sulfobacillus acidophilus TPY]|uniref:RNA polymerase sigma factor n=1 Tax=Sulfobacillus acidophilus (strain ATCC 700253 / DSM 10332 / NAL) TaxID=679936 RepID=G8TX37_SULAD|nr:RNA polymerase sigma-e factor [Sulfobacillus acidophilus TPY]AEW04945.1 RNA polymerase, sigma 29 subunit, SigE [Sulfobacillus acidophilus DSM 10332]